MSKTATVDEIIEDKLKNEALKAWYEEMEKAREAVRNSEVLRKLTIATELDGYIEEGKQEIIPTPLNRLLIGDLSSTNLDRQKENFINAYIVHYKEETINKILKEIEE